MHTKFILGDHTGAKISDSKASRKFSTVMPW